MAKIQSSTAKKNYFKKKFLIPYAFLFPALALFFTFFYLPTFQAFYYSLTDYHFLGTAEWTGFDNYTALMSDSLFWTALTNSFQYLIIMVPILVAVPLLVAVLVNQTLRGISFFRLLIFLPVVTPMVAVAIGWKFVYHPSGLLNGVFHWLGFDVNVNWLLNPDLALPAIAILQSWKFVGYYMVIYLAGLQAIPKDLIEAARLDGANQARLIWNIYVPLLRPITAVVLILSTMEAVRVFTSVFIMTGGGPLDSTISLPLYVYEKAFVELDMGYASAIGMVLWAILMVLTYLNLKLSRGDEAV